MQIEGNVWVTVRYRLFDSSGEPIEDNERELTYLHGGFGAVFTGIEQALEGHVVGDSVAVYLEPQDSFGDYDPELLRLAPRAGFPAELEPGMTFEGVPEEDNDGVLYTVTDITEESVVLDGNHPLAGMALRFELNVTDVRLASEEEIEEERARLEGEQ